MSLMLRDFGRALDPVAFARDAGLEPHPWQIKMLEGRSQREIFCCCRQSGKSTSAAARALHTALYQPGTLTLLLSPSLRQSSELFHKVIALYGRLADLPKLQALSALRLELPNGSRIISLPGSDVSTRGYSDPRLVIIDEAAFCSESMVAAVAPMLATGTGSLLALSTPNGSQGWFADAWHNDDSWDKHLVTWQESGRVNPEMVEFYRRLSGDLACRQEFSCEFIDVANTQLIGATAFDAAVSEKVPCLWI